MKRKLLIAVPLLGLVALMAWMFRPKRETVGEAFVSERSVTLWSSVAQVRQPIYKSSLERWRKYEAFLAPLLAELD